MFAKRTVLAAWVLWLTIICCPLVHAIEPDEVRNFEDVFLISAFAPDRYSIEITWDIAAGYYLYNNKFLQFRVQTPGVTVGEPVLPRGETSFDELLGEEVEKYHGQLTVTLPLLSVAPGLAGLRLNARSQGCLEGVLCYPPTNQIVLVGLPADSGGGAVDDPAGPCAGKRHPVKQALSGEEPGRSRACQPVPAVHEQSISALPASRRRPLAGLTTVRVRRLRHWMQTAHSSTKPSD